MIRAFVVYCMVLNPTLCRSLEIVPADDHRIASPMECLMGGAIFDAGARMAQGTPETNRGPVIAYEGIVWRVTRIVCRDDGAENDAVRQWLEDQREQAARLAPQIK